MSGPLDDWLRSLEAAVNSLRQMQTAVLANRAAVEDVAKRIARSSDLLVMWGSAADVRRLSRQAEAAWTHIDSQLRLPAVQGWIASLSEREALGLAFPPAMAQAGWPPPRQASLKLMREVVGLDAGGRPNAREAVDRVVVEHHPQEVVDAMLESWRERLPCRRRHHIVVEAIAAHRRGDYYCSVPVLLAQSEGLIADGTGHAGRMSGKALEKRIADVFHSQDASRVQSAVDEAVLRFFQSVVIVPFEHGKPVESTLSRHAIMHGGDVGYGTLAGSLKAILLFDYFQSPFRYASIPGKQVYHEDGCPRLRTSHGRMRFYRSADAATRRGKRPCLACKPSD